MTIQEAIKSGKPFKRKSHEYNAYYKVEDDRLLESFEDWDDDGPKLRWYNPEYTGFEALDVEDILADDWELMKEME